MAHESCFWQSGCRVRLINAGASDWGPNRFELINIVKPREGSVPFYVCIYVWVCVPASRIKEWTFRNKTSSWLPGGFNLILIERLNNRQFNKFLKFYSKLGDSTGLDVVTVNTEYFQGRSLIRWWEDTYSRLKLTIDHSARSQLHIRGNY